MSIMRSVSAMAVMAALAWSANPAEAQNRDLRWLGFVGCWEAVDAEDEIGLLCFREAAGGVELTNYADGQAVSTERLVADGEPRSIEAEGCEGWESVQFSTDRHRVFTRTEFTCAEGDSRSGTGVMAFLAPNRWVDVRVLDIDGEKVSWIQEYRLVGVDRLAEHGLEDPAAEVRTAVRTSRIAAAQPIDLDDVVEATGHVDEHAVEAWIVAQGDELGVDAEALVRLDDAGVPDRVIDAVVAVSNPERFVVAAGAPDVMLDDAPRRGRYRGYMGYDPWFGPATGFAWEYGAYGYAPYSYFGYRRGYYPWGYYGAGYGGGYWGPGSRIVIVERRSPNQGGSIVNGRGYRPSSTGATSGRIARPRGGAQPSYGRAGSGSRGAAVSGSGGSGSSRGSGRTARRRGGGD